MAAANLVRLHKAGLPTQIAQALWRTLTAGDAAFVARTCGLPQQTTKQLDQITTDTIYTLFNNTPAANIPSPEIWIPIKKGRLGFTSAQLTAAPAYVTGWTTTAPQLLDTSDYDDMASLLTNAPATHTLITAVANTLDADVLNTLLAINTCAAQLRPRQALLAAAARDTVYTDYMATLDTHQQARMRSAAGPGAGAFLLTPTQPEHHMTNNTFHTAIALRTGQAQT
jgi:hypothetical protein